MLSTAAAVCALQQRKCRNDCTQTGALAKDVGNTAQQAASVGVNKKADTRQVVIRWASRYCGLTELWPVSRIEI